MDLIFSFFSGFLLGILIIFIYFFKKITQKNKKIFQLEAENKYFTNIDVQNKLIFEFENTANKILKQNTDEFSKLSKKEIEELIKPFREKIAELSSNIEKTRMEGAKEFSSLETQIKILSQNNQRISEEANKLANAIKGESKIRGNWGEAILKRLLEVSGLQENIHYTLQESFQAENGSFCRPDVVIYMPENRHLIIDSKVSLISYEKYYNSEDETDKNLKEYISSVKEHIKNLKSKFYQDIKDINSPDFVLMFIPVEASFSLLLDNDAEIFEFARKNRVLPVSPSTLLVTLKTIEMFWKQKNQEKNVAEIAEAGGKLYDKFAGLLTDIDVLRNYFSKTINCFDNLNKKLEGKGGLIGQVEKIRELGAKTTKEIPESFLKLE